MFTINFDYLFKFLLNYIFISIPQAVVIILFILLLLKEYDYFKTENLKNTLLDILMIAGIQSSFFMNYLFYFTTLNLFLRLFCNTLIMFAFINILLKSTIKEPLWKEHLNSYAPEASTKLFKRYISEDEPNFANNKFRVETDKYIFTIENNIPKVKYKNKKGIYMSVVLTIAILYSLEIFTALCLQYVFKFDINSLSDNIINGILFAYPTIIILGFSVYLSYIYISINESGAFRAWNSNKKFRMVTYIQGGITFIFSALVYIFIIEKDLLNAINPDTAFKIILAIYVLLILQVVIYIRRYFRICNEEK